MNDLVTELQRNAAIARDFVTVIHAPSLYKRLTKIADLCDRAAAEIHLLEATNASLKKALK